MDDVDLILTNAELGITRGQHEAVGPDGRLTQVCFGLAISWSADAAVPELEESVSISVLSYSSFRDEGLGIEFDLPNSWDDGATPMPYASCFTCLVLGPIGAEPPYGISIFETVGDLSGPECGNKFGGCPIMAYFGIRGLRNGEETPLTVAGVDAAQQRIFRQPPLGLTNQTGELRLYHELATGVDTPLGTDLMIIGFYREDDGVGELEVEIAYDALLKSLAIEE